jgi:hypothetical protein
MKYQPLDDLEIFELFSAAFPEKFQGSDDDTWDAVQDFAESFGGFDEIADLLGRVVMLTMPMESGLTKRLRHCIGEVKVKDGQVSMIATVSRDVVTTPD